MPKFQFVAHDNNGKERRGMVEAPNSDLAATQIKSYGLIPASVSKVKVGGNSDKQPKRGREHVGSRAEEMKKPSYFGAAVGQKGLTIFTKQLSTLLQAGLPLLRALEVLLVQERNPAFKWLISELANNIRSGNTFSEGLGLFEKEFDRLYVNMVRAGEASGMLDLALNRLSTYLYKVQQMKGKLMAAMIYPAVVTFMSFGIVAVLLRFVVPQFEKIFQEQLDGQSLPALTQFVIKASNFVANQWYLALGILVFGVIGIKLLSATHGGKRTLDFMKLHIPKIGDLFSKIYISRFARTLGTLLESGVPVLDALNITRDSCGNAIIMDAVEKVRNRVKDGESISRPLSTTNVFPPMVTSMIEVGEETGELPEMLTQVSEIYDEEVDNAVFGLTALVEPLLIVFLAVIIVFIVLAIFLPFIKIIQGFAT